MRESRSTDCLIELIQLVEMVAQPELRAVPQPAVRQLRRHLAKLAEGFATESRGDPHFEWVTGDARHLDGWTGRHAVLVGHRDRNRRHDARSLGESHLHPNAIVDCDGRQSDRAEDAEAIQADDVAVNGGLMERLPRRRADLREDDRLLDVNEPRHVDRDDGSSLERLLREARRRHQDERERRRQPRHIQNRYATLSTDTSEIGGGPASSCGIPAWWA